LLLFFLLLLYYLHLLRYSFNFSQPPEGKAAKWLLEPSSGRLVLDNLDTEVGGSNPARRCMSLLSVLLCAGRELAMGRSPWKIKDFRIVSGTDQGAESWRNALW
jgi:hypothetical protein